MRASRSRCARRRVCRNESARGSARRRPELAGDLPRAGRHRRASRQADPPRPAGIRRHGLRAAAGTRARAGGARPRAVRHLHRPPAHVRRCALCGRGAGRALPRQQLLHLRQRPQDHPGGTGRLHPDLPVRHPPPVHLRPAAAGCRPHPGQPAGQPRHVQPRRVRRHRQERRGERQPGHRPGQPEHAAHAGQRVPVRLRHRRARAHRRAADRSAGARAGCGDTRRSANTSPRWSRTARRSSSASARSRRR